MLTSKGAIRWLSACFLVVLLMPLETEAASRKLPVTQLKEQPVTKASGHDSQVVKDVLAAADWMAMALNSSGYDADFSMESLRELDRFFDEHSADGKPLPNGLLAEQTGNRLFSLGAYTGEVLRRNLGGEWHGDDGDPKAEISVELRFGEDDKIWPVQKVMKRFMNGAEDSIYFYGRYLESQIKVQ